MTPAVVSPTIEWGAITVAVMVVFFAGSFFGAMVRDQGKKIVRVDGKVDAVAERVTTIETKQIDCRKEVETRLNRGDKTFDKMDTQIIELKDTTGELKSMTRQMGKMVQKVDDRMWQKAAPVVSGQGG